MNAPLRFQVILRCHLTLILLGVVDSEVSTGSAQSPPGNSFPYRLQIQDRSEEIDDVVFDSGSSLMASASMAGKLSLWDTGSARILWSKTMPDDTLLNPVGFTSSHDLVVVEIRRMEKVSRFGGTFPGSRSDRRVVVYDSETANPIAEHSFPLIGEEVLGSDDRMHPYTQDQLCLDALPEEGAAPGRVRALNVLTGSAETIDATAFLKVRNFPEVRANTNKGYEESASLQIGDIHIAMSGHTPALTATRNGVSLWKSDLLPGASGHIWLGGLSGDHSGKYLWYYSKPNMGYGPFAVVETATGRTVFAHRLPVLDWPSLYQRSGTDECWMTTVAAKDSQENDSAARFERVFLDGSDRTVPVPLPGSQQWPTNAEIFHDRFLVAANANGPQAVWCWDLTAMRLLWWRPAASGAIWDDCAIRLSGDSVVVTWASAPFEAFDLRTGRPVEIRSTENEARFGTMPTPEEAGASKETFQLPEGTQRESLAITANGKVAVFASEGEMFLWNTETNYRVDLVVLGGERVDWIAYDQTGYFEASPGGGSLVCAIEGLRAHPIDQFALLWNRPDLLLESLGTADAQTLEVLREAHGRRIARNQLRNPNSSDVGSVSPPSVQLLESRVEQGQPTLKIACHDAMGKLANVSVFVNDVPVQGRGGISVSGTSVELDLDVPLGAGQNKIELGSVSSDGRESPRIQVRLDGGVTKSKPGLFFLGIATSEYEEENLPDLPLAAKDASDLASAFDAMEGDYRTVQTRVMTNDDVSSDLQKVVTELTQEAEVDDLVVLFLAGHGMQEGGQYFYLPAKAETDRLQETALAFDKLEEILESIPSRRRLLLIDTCESGEAGPSLTAERKLVSTSVPKGGGTLARAISGKSSSHSSIDRTEPLGSFSSNDLFRRTGTVVFTACQADELSYESDRVKNGLFTAALLRAFSDSGADANRDGLLNKGELVAYVTENVSELAREEGLRQTPVVERDNLEERLGFPAATGTGATDGAYLKTEYGPIIWHSGIRPAARCFWMGGQDADGFAFGTGRLIWSDSTEMEFGMEDSGAKEVHVGAMFRGRFDGPTRSTIASVNYRVWWEGGIPISRVQENDVSVLSSPPMTLVGQGGIAGLAIQASSRPRIPMANFTNGTAGYMQTLDKRALVWNNHPRAGDEASWEGATDVDGFATGAGVLTWYKRKQFVTDYEGAMIKGKLEGRSVSINLDGSSTVRFWRDGKKQ